MNRDAAALGREAATGILRLLDREPPAEAVMVAAVVQRESTAPPGF